MLAGGVTDSRMIAAESFALAKDEIYAKAKPTAVPVIDHFVDVSPSHCATNAPSEITNASVQGPASFDNAASKKIVRERLFEAGVRLATVLNSIFQWRNGLADVTRHFRLVIAAEEPSCRPWPFFVTSSEQPSFWLLSV